MLALIGALGAQARPEVVVVVNAPSEAATPIRLKSALEASLQKAGWEVAMGTRPAGAPHCTLQAQLAARTVGGQVVVRYAWDVRGELGGALATAEGEIGPMPVEHAREVIVTPLMSQLTAALRVAGRTRQVRVLGVGTAAQAEALQSATASLPGARPAALPHWSNGEWSWTLQTSLGSRELGDALGGFAWGDQALVVDYTGVELVEAHFR